MSDFCWRETGAGRGLVITLNRPEARNAVNIAFGTTLVAATKRLDEDDSLSLGVLTGAGKIFASEDAKEARSRLRRCASPSGRVASGLPFRLYRAE